VRLGGLSPEDVTVRIYYGPIDAGGAIDATSAEMVVMESEGEVAPDTFHFAGQIPGHASGAGGYAVCVLPHHPDLASPYGLHLIRWAAGAG